MFWFINFLVYLALVFLAGTGWFLSLLLAPPATALLVLIVHFLAGATAARGDRS